MARYLLLPGCRLAKVAGGRVLVLEAGRWVASSPEDRAQLAQGEPVSAAEARQLVRQAERLVWREGDVTFHHGEAAAPALDPAKWMNDPGPVTDADFVLTDAHFRSLFDRKVDPSALRSPDARRQYEDWIARRGRTGGAGRPGTRGG